MQQTIKTKNMKYTHEDFKKEKFIAGHYKAGRSGNLDKLMGWKIGGIHNYYTGYGSYFKAFDKIPPEYSHLPVIPTDEAYDMCFGEEQENMEYDLEKVFQQYANEYGMDKSDVKATTWHKDGLIESWDWLINKIDTDFKKIKPPVPEPEPEIEKYVSNGTAIIKKYKL